MVSVKTIDLIVRTVKERNISYDTIAEKAGIGKTTVYRLITQRKASAYTIGKVVAYLEIGEQVRELEGTDYDADETGCEFASELCAELRDLRVYYEQKAAAVRESFEERIAYLKERLATLTEERKQEREDQKAAYERNVAHLNGEIIAAKDTIRLQQESIRRKDTLLTITLVVAVGLFILALVFLFSDSVLR